MDESIEDTPRRKRFKRSNVSQAETLEEIGKFWDEHDFTEFDTDRPDVEFTFNLASNNIDEQEDA